EGIDDVPYRVQQQKRIPLEGHDVADGGAAAEIQVAAVPDDGDVDDSQQQVPGRPDDQLAPLREQLLAQHGVPPAHVVEQFVNFAAEGPDHANPGECFAHSAVDQFRIL